MNTLTEQLVPLIDARRRRLPLSELLLEPSDLRKLAIERGELWACYIVCTANRFHAFIHYGPARDGQKERYFFASPESVVATACEAVGNRHDVIRQVLTLPTDDHKAIQIEFPDT